MQETATSTEARPAWPWQAEDLRVTREGLAVITLPWWQRWSIALCSIIALLLVVGGGVLIQQRQYRQSLVTTAQWISQESQREATCLHGAKTDVARQVCAAQAANRVAAAQNTFNQDSALWGDENAASQMNDAFNALAGATCVDPTSGTADLSCLNANAPRLWLIAQMDARAAATE
jgi:hypothetical protein